MAVDLGTTAPDFELPDQTNQPVRLTDFRGKKNVVLLFYPSSFTRTCSAELCTLRDDLSAYQNDDSQLLAISVDSPATHRAFAEAQGFTFPLLADFWPHGGVAENYGVFNDTFGVALRATFVIDTDGVVRYKTVNPVQQARDPEEVKQRLAGLD